MRSQLVISFVSSDQLVKKAGFEAAASSRPAYRRRTGWTVDGLGVMGVVGAGQGGGISRR